MGCGRKPSEVIVAELASDGGWTWVCRRCRKGREVIGTVGRAT